MAEEERAVVFLFFPTAEVESSPPRREGGREADNDKAAAKLLASLSPSVLAEVE